MAGNGPAGRLKFRSKDGVSYDVGAFWDSGRGLSLTPVKANEDHPKYPKMRLSLAAKHVEEGNGYLNVYGLVAEGAAPRREARQELRRARRDIGEPAPPEDDFDPDDCGF